mmetsp:Transcript_24937/g.69548  ORF Transcript_24937/g.69548 Transcript_24937/m.69548 type:complete len:890 (-) Transcript_24937:66-2735(-)|eukprot:CAMPEP_0117666390 /NCGR_PEP_ID=MMETSP0804-20121206/10350_1 /TAXON_ID=1074897 /ORGANISM="Tetraselmis astigmatica, Strain CCMP880" /LENGTH=889 /DNA_ID=CAMNT_0005473931 /DNA_START=326 /DNA_END=2995 /DNA_ORIENTATION=-
MAQRWRDAVRLMGPAFLVSVAYLDPGNWATAIEGGSRFGYDLVWVVVLSNLIAILLQTLAARLGLVTGKHLALLCRQEYPRLVCVLLWVLCEISIVALDLTMVIGTAVGLNLLFRLPLLQCILLSGLDSLLLVLLVPSLGLRKGELLTVGLILVVVCCFLCDLILSNPPIIQMVSGLWPRLSRDSLYTAVSLLGANVMPHNFYLHSALVSGQASQIGRAGCSVAQLCRYNQMDISVALGIALLVNVAVMCVAAATFHSAGITVRTLQDAHDVMEQLISSSAAPAVFGMALLCAGQLSTFTGTISGQVVLKGFMNMETTVWARRLLTRSAAVIPAAVLQVMYGSTAIYQMLLIAQVVLALQLPFTLVPLIKITSSQIHMGPFANSRATQFAAWGATLLIFAANLVLCAELIWPSASPGSAGLREETQPWLISLLGNVEELGLGSALLAVGYLVCVVGAATGLSLLLWMIMTPLKETPRHVKDTQTPLLASRPYEWSEGQGRHHPHTEVELGSVQKQQQQQRDDEEGAPVTGSWHRLHPRHSTTTETSAFLLQQLPSPGLDSSSSPYSYTLTVSTDSSPRSLTASPTADCWEDLVDIVTDTGEPARPTLWPASQPGQPQSWDPSAGSEADPTVVMECSSWNLGQATRRQFAAILNSFWCELYDMHGQPVPLGGSRQEGVSAREAEACWPGGRAAEKEPSGLAGDCSVAQVEGCLVQLQLEGASSLMSPSSSVAGPLGETEAYIGWLSSGSRPRPPVNGSHLSSFGVWCILRMLQLMQTEPRPELWGRYSAVLNRLQGVVLHRMPVDPVSCHALDAALLEHVGPAQANVQSRLRPGGHNAAAEAAFPKGKEIAISVLKRYRRHLSREAAMARSPPGSLMPIRSDGRRPPACE